MVYPLLSNTGNGTFVRGDGSVSLATTTASCPAPLRSVFFVSSASSVLSDAEFERMLARARRRNQKSDITGVLLRYEGAFMQSLEGPADALASLLDDIRTDPRHCCMFEMPSERTTVRLCGAEPLAYFRFKAARDAEAAFARLADERAHTKRMTL